MFGLSTELTFLLLACLAAACIFELINGFHDTANAVASVIYTNALKPGYAVVWSAICNFIGVNVGGIAVAIGIINILPVEALIDKSIYHGLSMIASLILTAIIWNLGTWYFGIPCSSSHTLIGSIFGVGLAYMILPGSSSVSLNWSKVYDIGLSLLISPVIGFFLALLLMFLLKRLVKNKVLYKEPPSKKAPPFWIRTVLILTCTSVSFTHGSNDGQKGVGLVMMILIAFVPSYFAIDMQKNPSQLNHHIVIIDPIIKKTSSSDIYTMNEVRTISLRLDSIKAVMIGRTSFMDNKSTDNFDVRKDILLVAKSIKKLIDDPVKYPMQGLTSEDKSVLLSEIGQVRSFTEYAPWWVILMISISLGIGTMVGWKRIVITIGEKIGKTHMSYAQGAVANLIAASTIGLSSLFGLPVSTTHVLSSGVAGSMVSGGGLKNLQGKTITNIIVAWLVTLPVTILLSGMLFLLFNLFLT
jgi:inorganic phosphate transporter, PiT family